MFVALPFVLFEVQIKWPFICICKYRRLHWLCRSWAVLFPRWFIWTALNRLPWVLPQKPGESSRGQAGRHRSSGQGLPAWAVCFFSGMGALRAVRGTQEKTEGTSACLARWRRPLFKLCVCEQGTEPISQLEHRARGEVYGSYSMHPGFSFFQGKSALLAPEHLLLGGRRLRSREVKAQNCLSTISSSWGLVAALDSNFTTQLLAPTGFILVYLSAVLLSHF